LVISGCGDAADEAPKAAPMRIDWESELLLDIQQQRRALEDFDIDAGAALMCDQYRDAYRRQLEALLPTMASIATPEQATDPAYVAALPDAIKERYPNTYTEERTNLADAAVRQDPAAFRAAAAELMTRILEVEDQQVAEIDISGGDTPGGKPDGATADVTTTTAVNGGPPETRTVRKSFVLQGTDWLDCTDPAA
jgi:hypothetical protein